MKLTRKRMDIISAFFATLDPDTERAYARALNNYIEWCGDCSSVSACRYIGYLCNQGYADATIKCTYSALSSIFGVLEDCGEIKKNPFRAARRFKALRQHHQVRPTKTIDSDSIMPIINSVPIDDSKGKGYRDRAMFALLFGCGLRRSELQMIKISDIQVDHKSKSLFLFITKTKGGTSRKQPIPEWAIDYISAYITNRSSIAACGNDYLFDSRYGDRSLPMSTETIYRRFKARFDAAPHAARAAFATKLREMGHDLQSVADALGHKGIDMVRVYDHRERSISSNVGKLVQY